MRKGSMKKLWLSLLGAGTALCLTACAQSMTDDGSGNAADADVPAGTETEALTDTDLLSWLEDRVLELMEEDQETALYKKEAETVSIDQIYYGSFTQQGANEVLVICRFSGGLPHDVEPAACVLLDADTLEMITCKTIGGSVVTVNRLETADGQSRLFVSIITTYQGHSGQYVWLYSLQDGQWAELPTDALDALLEAEYGEVDTPLGGYANGYCSLVSGGDWEGKTYLIVATHNSDYLASLNDPSEVIAVLVWDPSSEQFVLNG